MSGIPRDRIAPVPTPRYWYPGRRLVLSGGWYRSRGLNQPSGGKGRLPSRSRYRVGSARGGIHCREFRFPKICSRPDCPVLIPARSHVLQDISPALPVPAEEVRSLCPVKAPVLPGSTTRTGCRSYGDLLSRTGKVYGIVFFRVHTLLSSRKTRGGDCRPPMAVFRWECQ